MGRQEVDPYEILGLGRGATWTEIRAAYRRLAKKHHPDKNPGDKASEWIFKEVGRAYERLRGTHGANGPDGERRGRERDSGGPSDAGQRDRQDREQREREQRERAERVRREQERAERRERPQIGVIEKNGQRLSTLDAWFDHAPPKEGRRHWKDGRSAKESAKSWLTAAPVLPAEIAATLSSHPDIGTLGDWRAEPEAEVPIDEFYGPPNVDVLLVGRDRSGSVVVAVDAKADEPFGGTVDETLRAARSRLDRNPRSKGVARVERLLAALLGTTMNDRDVLELRYQLLTVTAAAMAEAERRSAQRAVVMVHEFATPLTNDEKRTSNARDLNRFVARIAGRRGRLEPGRLGGPFKVPGKPVVNAGISLYFGRAVVDKR